MKDFLLSPQTSAVVTRTTVATLQPLSCRASTKRSDELVLSSRMEQAQRLSQNLRISQNLWIQTSQFSSTQQNDRRQAQRTNARVLLENRNFQDLCENALGFVLLDFEAQKMRIRTICVSFKISLLHTIVFLLRMVKVAPPPLFVEVSLVKTAKDCFVDLNADLKAQGFRVRSIEFDGNLHTHNYRAAYPLADTLELPTYFMNNVSIRLPSGAAMLEARVVLTSANKHSGFARAGSHNGFFDVELLVFFSLLNYEQQRQSLFDRIAACQTPAFRRKMRGNKLQHVEIVTLTRLHDIAEKFRQQGHADGFSSDDDALKFFHISVTFVSFIRQINFPRQQMVVVCDAAYLRVGCEGDILAFRSKIFDTVIHLFKTDTPGVYVYAARSKWLAEELATRQKSVGSCVQEMFRDIDAHRVERSRRDVFVRRFSVDLPGVDLHEYISSVDRGALELKTLLMNVRVRFNREPADQGLRYEFGESDVVYHDQFFFGFLSEDIDDVFGQPFFSVFVSEKSVLFE